MNYKDFMKSFKKSETAKAERALKKKLASVEKLAKLADGWLTDKVKAIVILGETPLWNDGEDLVHSDNYAVFYSDGKLDDGYDFHERYSECFDWNDAPDLARPRTKEHEEGCLEFSKRYGKTICDLLSKCETKIHIEKWGSYNGTISPEKKDEISVANKLYNLAFGTNFIVILTRNEDGIQLEKLKYEPQY